MTSVVYKITNTINKKYYIGSSHDFEHRIQRHFNEYSKIKEPNKELYKDIEKYGKEFFKTDILFESDDSVEIARMESKLIRESADSKLMYNTTIGASGRRVFYESDVIFIRKLYSEKKMYITEAYKKYYEGIVSFRAFKKLWHGDTFKNISYEVYTQENKEFHFAKGQSRRGEINGRSVYKEVDVREIRRRKNKGELKSVVKKDYEYLGAPHGFDYIWNGKNWKYIK